MGLRKKLKSLPSICSISDTLKEKKRYEAFSQVRTFHRSGDSVDSVSAGQASEQSAGGSRPHNRGYSGRARAGGAHSVERLQGLPFISDAKAVVRQSRTALLDRSERCRARAQRHELFGM